jgi:hypothetical protein
MKKMNGLLIIIAGIACLGIGNAPAQDSGFGGGRGGGFDATQIQQQIQQTRMNNYRKQLEVSDDIKWAAIKEKIQKVLDAKQDPAINPMISEMSGILGLIGRGLNSGAPGAAGTGNADAGAGGMARRNLANLGIALSPEEEALQKAVDAKSSIADLKAAQAKVIEARKARQAKLDKAQEELRKLLSTRQEAIAMLIGLF